MAEERTSIIGQRRIIKGIFWSTFTALFAWVGYQNVVPTGKMIATYTMPNGGSQFAKLVSDDADRLVGRTTKGGQSFLSITHPPLSFSVFAPRAFTAATVKLTYQNPDNQPVLRLGIQQAGPGFLYRDMVVNDPTLDALPAWWQKVTDGSMTLWQRNIAYEQKVESSSARKAERQKVIDQKFQQDVLMLEKDEARKKISAETLQKERAARTDQHDQDLAALEQQFAVDEKALGQPEYATIADFLRQTPDPQKTLLFNTTLPPLKIANYTPATTRTVITTSLRGPHKIVTYIGKGEKLSFKLTLQDINQNSGTDPFSVAVSDVNKTVMTQKLEPLGSEGATGIPSNEQTVTIERTGLSDGVYTLALLTDDDVFIKRIETTQRYVVFAKTLYLAENQEYAPVLGDRTFAPTTIVTDSTTLTALTEHPEGLQTLAFGAKSLTLLQVQKDYTTKLTTPPTSITAPQNDVKLSGDGYFAFTRDQMFDPPRYSTYSQGTNLEGYDFILADYPQPQQRGDWLVAQTTMTNEVHTNKDHLVRFSIAMPGLADNHRTLKIHSVQVIFEKHPLTPRYLWSKLTAKLHNLLKR